MLLSCVNTPKTLYNRWYKNFYDSLSLKLVDHLFLIRMALFLGMKTSFLWKVEKQKSKPCFVAQSLSVFDKTLFLMIEFLLCFAFLDIIWSTFASEFMN